jgi:hypothetical protein
MSTQQSTQQPQTEQTKPCETEYCPNFNPQLLTKGDVIINTSTSKHMYSFGKASRFGKHVDLSSGNAFNYKTSENFFYDLPSVFDQNLRRTYRHGAAFGFGTKSDFTHGHLKGKTDNYYNIPSDFDFKVKHSPQYSLGKGREECKRSGTVNYNNNPGPGTYNANKPLGHDALKFSLFGRTWAKDNGATIPKPKCDYRPGPGEYKYLNINKDGKYASSMFRNTAQKSFGTGSPRFTYTDNKVPGPGHYKMGLVKTYNNGIYNSKYASNVAKTFSYRPKEFFSPRQTGFPGPGSYEIFSDFGGFSRIKKCKFRKKGEGNNNSCKDDTKSRNDNGNGSKQKSKTQSKRVSKTEENITYTYDDFEQRENKKADTVES